MKYQRVGTEDNGKRSGLLMPTVADPDLVHFEPPEHPTIRAAFRSVIESYPRALYDEQGLVRYRTRFLDSVFVSEPELIHDILVARADLFRRDDVARQLLSPMLGPTSLFMAEGADWKWKGSGARSRPPSDTTGCLLWSLHSARSRCGRSNAGERRHASSLSMSPRLWQK